MSGGPIVQGPRCEVRSAAGGFQHGVQPALLAASSVVALAIGILVYLTDRAAPNAALIPAFAKLAGGPLFGVVGQWLPSFVHPFAFSLLTAATLPARSTWRYHACVVWCAVNIAFEFGQHASVSARVAAEVQSLFGSTASSRWVPNYFLHGTFDPGDIAAAVLGALAAALLLRLTQRLSEDDHAQ